MESPIDPFTSARLLYRAVETPEDDSFFEEIQKDSIGYEQSNAGLVRPQSRKDAVKYQKYIAEEALLGVVICIPAAHESRRPIPIGTIHLKKLPPHMMQHRFTEISIDLLPAYQGKGYGTEAIKWCLEWAFQSAGMHRVGVRAFGWNERARKLYEKIGFKQEGISREQLFYRGRWWDDYQFGMLVDEWEQLYGKEE